MNKINIAVVDDHQLFRKGMVNLISSLKEDFLVTIEAENGQDFIDTLTDQNIPDIVILDISMPKMDGFETAKYLQKQYPDLKILVLSMNEDEQSLIRMLNFGVKGFVSKDIEPNELILAISKILHGGIYYSDQLTEHLINTMQPNEQIIMVDSLTKKELAFLRAACSEKSYNEIAADLCVSPKTVEGYRDTVYSKLNIKSRVGLVLFAIKTGIFNLS
ncbi:MAG: response regulator [Putridiphycobacter sp.]